MDPCGGPLLVNPWPSDVSWCRNKGGSSRASPQKEHYAEHSTHRKDLFSHNIYIGTIPHAPSLEMDAVVQDQERLEMTAKDASMFY